MLFPRFALLLYRYSYRTLSRIGRRWKISFTWCNNLGQYSLTSKIQNNSLENRNAKSTNKAVTNFLKQSKSYQQVESRPAVYSQQLLANDSSRDVWKKFTDDPTGKKIWPFTELYLYVTVTVNDVAPKVAGGSVLSTSCNNSHWWSI